MYQFNNKEKRILSITLTGWGIFLIGSGLIMNFQDKPIYQTKYTLSVEEKKIAEAQAKTNEIKLKNPTIELNTPLSVDIKDYLEETEKISNNTLKELKIDTSLVNISQAGSYQYTISYNKKKYIGTIIIKEKEMPKITLKTLTFEEGSAKPYDDASASRNYINETLSEEIYATCSAPNFENVDFTKPYDDYLYTIKCSNTTYTGKIIINKKPFVVKEQETKGSIECNGPKCECENENEIYDETTNKCISKEDNSEKNNNN